MRLTTFSKITLPTKIETAAKLAAKRRYYEKNKEEVKARSAKWREENKEAFLEDQKARSRARRLADPEGTKRKSREYSLKRKYGITIEQYEELLTKQNRCCAICDRHESVFTVSMAVDHNHKTGEIRGILCTHCNHRLVGRHTEGELLRRIADYVERGTGWIVPPKPKKKRKRSSKPQKS